MARRRKGRPIDGILLLDKPTGISSNDALQKVKRFYFAEKAGHTGALDPLATGMLPICLGEATKFSQFLLDSDKTYRVIAKLGERTNTSDSDGEVIETRPVDVTPEVLLTHINGFLGETQQVPSMFSALKYQGKPLYEYARAGIEVPRESRLIKVFRIDLVRFEGDEVEMEVHCSKGTYIRTIVDDLGQLLGCGAHVIMLRRLAVANYPADKMMTLEQLAELVEQAQQNGTEPKALLDALLLPMDSALGELAEVNLLPELAQLVRLGQAVALDVSARGNLLVSETVKLTVGDDKAFIGVGTITEDGKVNPKRLLTAV